MSTKIYNGYRVHTPDPFDALTKLRAAIEPIYETLYNQALAQIAHAAHAGRHPENDRVGIPIITAMAYLEDQHTQIKKTGRRNPAFDLELDACFLRDPDDAGQLYAVLYTEQPAYRAAYPPVFEPWPYWNNTDRPDDVTDAEWGTRRDTWDRLVGWDPPARRGLGWELIGIHHRHHFPDLDDAAGLLGPHLPDGFNVAALYEPVEVGA